MNIPSSFSPLIRIRMVYSKSSYFHQNERFHRALSISRKIVISKIYVFLSLYIEALNSVYFGCAQLRVSLIQYSMTSHDIFRFAIQNILRIIQSYSQLGRRTFRIVPGIVKSDLMPTWRNLTIFVRKLDLKVSQRSQRTKLWWW